MPAAPSRSTLSMSTLPTSRRPRRRWEAGSADGGAAMIATLRQEAALGAPQPPISVQDIRELNRLAALSPALALRQALPLVQHLAGEYADLLAAGPPAGAPPGQGD